MLVGEPVCNLEVSIARNCSVVNEIYFDTNVSNKYNINCILTLTFQIKIISTVF